MRAIVRTIRHAWHLTVILTALYIVFVTSAPGFISPVEVLG